MTIKRGRRSFSQEVICNYWRGVHGEEYLRWFVLIVKLEPRATEKAFIISILFNNNYL